MFAAPLTLPKLPAHLEKVGRYDDERSRNSLSFSEELQPAKIKVIGVAGRCNAVNRMIRASSKAWNSSPRHDLQALKLSQAPVKLQLGAKLTKGSAQAPIPSRPQSALEDTKNHRSARRLGHDFYHLRLGGAPAAARRPWSLRSPVNWRFERCRGHQPFAFEGKRRMMQADSPSELIGAVDTVIVIPNERLMDTVERGTSFFDAFRIADDILRSSRSGHLGHHHRAGSSPRLCRRESHNARQGYA